MIKILLLIILSNIGLLSMEPDVRNSFIGSAYSENISYEFLRTMCNTAGGRLAGSPSSKIALKQIQEKLEELGISHQADNYNIPGWERGNDYLRLISPFNKEIRSYTLGYSISMPETSGGIIYAGDGYEESYKNLDAKGKFAIIETEKAKGKPSLMRNDAIKTAAKMGAVGTIFIAAKSGGMVLVSTANFNGEDTAVPAFCITHEDGELLKAQIESNLHPKLIAEVKSKCKEIEITNIRAKFHGISEKKVILLAHYDSWDISTGAVDNGVGSAVLLEIARLIQTYSKENYYTVECIWVDAEEIGLWGAEKLSARISDSVVAVFNMDMPGSPTGINIMGYEGLRGISENFLNSLPGYKFDKGVGNEPWINSDHSPFMIIGIPSITFYGYMEKEMYWHYHDFADTFDKVNPKYMSDAAAIIGLFGIELANTQNMEKLRLSKEETKNMLIKHKLDEKLKRQGSWTE